MNCCCCCCWSSFFRRESRKTKAEKPMQRTSKTIHIQNSCEFPPGLGHAEGKPMFIKRTRTELLIDLAIFIVITAYFIPMLVISSSDENHVDGIEFAIVIYCFISLRLFARHVSVSQIFYEPIGRVFSTISRFSGLEGRPVLITYVLFATTATCVILTAIFSAQSANSSIPARLQSCAGIVAIIAFAWLISKDRKAIPWYTVASGLFLQYLIALFVLKTMLGQNIFKFISSFIANFLGFSSSGLEFILGPNLPNNFATAVLPAIVFFCSFISIVYYWGGMQYVVAKLAWAFVRLMDTSGAESVVACASPFVGQGESALLVGPFVQYMTKSELHSTMVSGFATIAGSVFVFYVTLVRDPSTILCCCVMSIPAGLLLSKMRYPEKEESISKGQVNIPPSSEEKEVNFLHAACNGAATGMTLIILISGSLLCIISLYTASNAVVGWLFDTVHIYDWTSPAKQSVTIELLASYIFTPIALLIGVPWADARLAGALMATKMLENEFVAYTLLREFQDTASVSPRTLDLMAFALCGFANFSSVGIQIGALGAIAPSRKKDLAELAVSAMLTGTAATWLCACMAGAIL